MPQDGNYIAFVDVGGVQAPEYDIQTAVGTDGVPEVRCAIVSETGKTFNARFMYSLPHGAKPATAVPANLLVRLIVDGKNMSKTRSPLLPNETDTLSSAVNHDIKQPLVFAAMTVVSHDAQVPEADRMVKADNVQAASIGKIVVEFCTGKRELRRTSRAGGAPFKQPVLAEHQKKAAFVSHSAGFGEPRVRQRSKSKYHFVCVKSVKRFIFEYASKDVHELSGRIPPASASTTNSTEKRKRRARSPAADHAGVEGGQVRKVKSEVVEDHKRRRVSGPGGGGSRSSTPSKVVVLLDDSDDEAAADPSRSRRVTRRPTQPNEEKFVVSFLDDDDE